MNVECNKHIVIIAGEASGDKLGAYLIKQVHQKDKNILFSGIGGEEMQAAGANITYNVTKKSATGITEVLSKLPYFWLIFQKIKHYLKKQKPDLLILIDFPEFNLRLAEYAKRLNIKILYYSSPQVWAWKKKRIHVIKKLIDKMAVFYPFERTFYQEHNVPVSLVHHPLLETVSNAPQNSHNIPLLRNDKVIGLFPGSRKNEIKRLLPLMCAAAETLKMLYPTIEFVLPVAKSIDMKTIQKHLTLKSNDILITTLDVSEIIPLCDIIVAASGTVTLEVALHKKPMVIVYKISALTHAIIKKIIRVKYAGLCNLMTNKYIVPELLQNDATVDNIVAEVRKYLDEKAYREDVVSQLAELSETLSGQECELIEDVVLSSMRV